MTDTEADVPVLDLAVLGELRASVGDDEFVRELVRTYVEEALPALVSMADAANAGNAEGLVRPAHTLKSTSAIVGALRLSAICRKLEGAGRNGDTKGLGPDVAAARSAWAETLEALRAEGLAE